VRHRGSCHCGRVRFEIESELDAFFRCNCSFCARRGIVHTYVPGAGFRLLEGEEGLSRYSFSPHSTEHGFCSTCGTFTHSASTWAGAQRVHVNAACLEGVDALNVATQPIDGRGFAVPEDVLEFWFGELDSDGLPDPSVSRRWFRNEPAFDDEIRERFGEAVQAAVAGHMESWANRPRGRVALIILLDQFTRNIGRGRAEAWSGDARALAHARTAIAASEQRRLLPVERYFLYMPFEHAEDLELQQRSVALFAELLALAPEAGQRLFSGGVDWAKSHRDEIARFGRFPGRNEALGRASTREELAWLRRPR
jgi:uncharacterized protein (DUF924 family)